MENKHGRLILELKYNDAINIGDTEVTIYRDPKKPNEVRRNIKLSFVGPATTIITRKNFKGAVNE